MIRYLALLVGLMMSSPGFASSPGCSGNGEGGKAFQRGDFLVAAQHWETARQSALENTPNYIDTSVCLADTYLRMGRLKDAFGVLEKARSSAETSNDKVRRAKVLMGLSNVYVAGRNYQYKQTDYGMRKVREAIAPFGKLKVLKKEHILQKALDTLEKADKLIACQNQETHRYPWLCANLLNRQGNVLLLQSHHFKQQRSALALKVVKYERKLKELKRKKRLGPLLKIHQRDIIGIKRSLDKNLFDEQNKSFAISKKYQDALSKYNSSKQFATQARDPVLTVRASINYIQALLFGLENKPSQSSSDDESVKLEKELQTLFQLEKPILGNVINCALNILGNQASFPKQPKGKNSNCGRAEYNSHEISSALINLAQLVRDLPPLSSVSQEVVNKFIDTKQTQQQVELSKILPEQRKRWVAYYNRKVAYHLLTKALEVAEGEKNKFSDDDIFSLAEIRGYQAELYAEVKHYDNAIQLTRSAIFHAQRYPHFNNHQELLARLQWQLGTYLKEQKKPKKAIQAYQTASEFFRKVRSCYGSVSPSVRNMEEQLHFEWANLLLKEASKVSEKEKPELLKQAIDTLELLKQAELRNFFKDGCITEKKEIEVDELLSSNPNVAVFYPIVLKDRVELLLISNQQIKQMTGFKINDVSSQKEIKTAEDFSNICSENLNSLLKKENFHQMVECFRYHLEEDHPQLGPKPDWLKLAEPLYQWLIKPVTDVLDKQPQIDTLIIVPSDILYSIPFAALHDGEKFLVQNKYALVITPSLKLIDPVPLSRDFRRVLLSGTGNFDGGNIPKLCYVPAELKRISSVLVGDINPKDNDEFTIEIVETWKNKFACLSPVKSGYRTFCLPKGASCSQDDDRDNLLIGKDRDILFDKEFTLSNLTKRFRKVAYSIVHLATHAQFSPEPGETFLQTYEGESKDKGRIILDDLEEFVHLADFRTQPIELLTLSACETALGDKRAAFGLSGVALKAGARSAVGTLWEVKDPSTAYVMSQFYRQLKKSPNLSVAGALQKAQGRLLQLGENATKEKGEKKYLKYQHPHYWAPFLLIGNWK